MECVRRRDRAISTLPEENIFELSIQSLMFPTILKRSFPSQRHHPIRKANTQRLILVFGREPGILQTFSNFFTCEQNVGQKREPGRSEPTESQTTNRKERPLFQRSLPRIVILGVLSQTRLHESIRRQARRSFTKSGNFFSGHRGSLLSHNLQLGFAPPCLSRSCHILVGYRNVWQSRDALDTSDLGA